MAMTRAVSSDPVTFRTLIPKKLNVSGMIAPIRDAAIKAAQDMGKDLEATTRTWKGDKPRIQTEAVLVPAGTPPSTGFHTSFTSAAWVKNDGSMGAKKFMWLDEGTRVRYAVMSKGFIPKTRTGQLNSWAGKGKMLFVSKKHPMPGIKARKFTVALRKKWERPTMFRARMQAAVKRAAKASGHAM
jgi:hypothetical protein